MIKLQCRWCHGEFDDIPGPVHEYIESSPGCWAAYSKVLAREYADYAAFSDIHRLTVDTYAVQHPGKPTRKAIQSVWAHLVAMHHYLVQGLDGSTTRERLKYFVERREELSWLEPPDFTDSENVNRVLTAPDTASHIERVREWGASVFERWFSLYGREIEHAATPRGAV